MWKWLFVEDKNGRPDIYCDRIFEKFPICKKCVSSVEERIARVAICKCSTNVTNYLLFMSSGNFPTEELSVL